MRDALRRRGAARGSEDQFRGGISRIWGGGFGGSAESSRITVDNPQPPAAMARNAAHEPERTRRTTRRMYCRTGIPPFLGSTGSVFKVCQETVFVIIRTIGCCGKCRSYSGDRSLPGTHVGRERKKAPPEKGGLLARKNGDPSPTSAEGLLTLPSARKFASEGLRPSGFLHRMRPSLRTRARPANGS